MKPAVRSGLSAAALLLAVHGGAAARRQPAAPLLQRPTGQAKAPAALISRLCPGTSESVLVQPAVPPPTRSAPDANERLKAALRLSPPLAGCQVTSERLTEDDGREAWLVHLQVPAGARPGHYTGQLLLSSGATVARKPAVIEVLPFDLMRPSKQYAVTAVPTSSHHCCVPDEAEVAPLRRLREIGIGSLCLAGAPAERAAWEGKMQAAGLRGPVLAPVESFAGSDHPSGVPGGDGSSASKSGAGTALSASPPRSAASHVRWYALCGTPPTAESAAVLRAGGTLIASRVERAEVTNGIDLPIFNAGGEAGMRLARDGGASAAGSPGWWHWDAGSATPLENRLRCGALLWKSGLSGALVEIDPSASAGAAWPLRWEGVCQGVRDSRYLTTLFSLIRQVKDKDRSSPLPGKAEVAIAAALNDVAERPSPESAERVREATITWILRLGRLVWS